MSERSTEELLRELVRLARVSTYPVAKEMLRESFFENDAPKSDWVRVYAHLDGRSQRAVAAAAGVSQSAVSRWTRRWQRLGLVGEEGKAVFNIFDFFPDLEGELDAD